MRPRQPESVHVGLGSTFKPIPLHRRRIPWRRLLVAMLLAVSLGVGAVWTNALGAGDRFADVVSRIGARVELFLDPPPDRPTKPTVVVTEPPTPTATATPSPTRRPSFPPNVTPPPEPTPTPAPVRKPVDVRPRHRPRSRLPDELTKEWCAPAGVQMTLAMLGLGDTSEAFQGDPRRPDRRVGSVATATTATGGRRRSSRRSRHTARPV